MGCAAVPLGQRYVLHEPHSVSMLAPIRYRRTLPGCDCIGWMRPIPLPDTLRG